MWALVKVYLTEGGTQKQEMCKVTCIQKRLKRNRSRSTCKIPRFSSASWSTKKLSPLSKHLFWNFRANVDFFIFQTLIDKTGLLSTLRLKGLGKRSRNSIDVASFWLTVHSHFQIFYCHLNFPGWYKYSMHACSLHSEIAVSNGKSRAGTCGIF